MNINSENKQWISDFYTKNKRPPKILHIGNIANNAYQNAKILIDAGLECDVISYDYYHIMGCPEWDDADFEGTVEDHFAPKWYSMKLNGFTRPQWFINGPLGLCLDYLIARQKGARYKTNILFNSLAAFNGTKNKHIFPYKYYFHILDIKIKLEAKAYLWKKDLKDFFITHKENIPSPLLKLLSFHRTSVKQRECLRERLVNIWKDSFPDRSDCLSSSDMEFFTRYIAKLLKVLDSYDFIIGYATDPFIPLLCDKPYFAFEHGTIRDIPYKSDAQGRLTLLAYNQAQHVFVTNFDCIPSANKIAPKRFSPVNHPWNEDHGLKVEGASTLRTRLCQELDSDFLCFFPTRHDWVAGKGFADKGNDIFLKAVAELRRMGIRIGVVCAAWGSNIHQSKELISEEGINNYISWVEPLPIVSFERMCSASDIVIDQFILGAFGGVLIKAMSMGIPVLTYLNEEQVLNQYTETPPVINCRTQDQIISAIINLYQNKDQIKELGKTSRDWIKKHHTKDLTLNILLNQFRLSHMGHKDNERDYELV